MRAWYDKYHDQGLEIIGVHTPEFAFEHLLLNVQKAVSDGGLKYPVVLDNEYGTWNAFGNQYWPRKYLVDIDGYIVYDHAGEGNYDVTEAAIQKALKERSDRLGLSAPMPTLTDTKPTGAVSTNASEVGSPETYFGSSRNQYLTNGTQSANGPQTLTLPSTFALNSLYLGGAWNFASEYASPTGTDGTIRYHFSAKSVYFVASATSPVKVKITIDGGKPLGAMKGADVDADGYVTIQTDKLYKLIEGPSYSDHILEMQIQGPGLKAYTFTFG